MVTDNDTPAPNPATLTSDAALPPKMTIYRSALLFLPIAILIFAGSWVPVASVDVWAHAAVGRWIVQHGHVPTHTLFLWTAHNPWIAHSWLTEVLLYYMIQGKTDDQAATAALIATAVTAALAFLVIYQHWRRKGALGPSSILIFGMAAIGSQSRFQPRAEMLSAILYTLLLVLIDGMQTGDDLPEGARRRRTSLYVIPLLVVAWVNLHGMFAFGLMVLALAAIGSLLQERLSPSTKVLASAIAISMLCSGINPYGYRLWTVLVAIKSNTFAHILEWQPVLVYPPIDYLDLTYTGVLILFSVIALIGNSNRRAFDVFLLFVQVVLLATARRYLYFMNLTSLWVIGNNLSNAWPVLARPTFRLPGSAGNIAIAVVVVLWIWTIWPSGHGRWLKLATADVLPTDQADWILAHHIKDNCLNDYDNSSYLEWRFKDGPLLATDALNAYPDSVQEMAAAMWAVTPKGLEALKYVDVVLGRRPKASEKTFQPLDYALHYSPYWVELFPSSSSGPIWLRLPPGVRRTRGNPAWISNIPNAPKQDSPTGR